ncbi:MAG: CapA family protein [Clostridia bacterium]|nr:CapA family protein [Clostridia bacterium]
MKKLFCLLLVVCLFTSCSGEDVPSVSTPEVTTQATLPSVTLLTEPKQEEVVVPKETRIHFVAAGDNIAHDSVIETARKDAVGNDEYDFSKIYAGIADFVSAADVAFINQEAPVGGKALGIAGYPNFNAPEEMVEELVDIGFDVFNLANNHMLDKGEKGYSNTIKYFESLPVVSIGGYTKSDYDNVRVLEVKGVKLAFLSYTTLVNYGHAKDISSGSEYIIPYANTEDITRQVALAKEAADVVIVSMHWGDENVFSATSSQKKYANLCADLGVDVVLGHHPHVVGGVEYLTGSNGGKTLVAYSLGNFCNTQLYARNIVGEFLSFDIVKDDDGYRIENAVVDPVIAHYKTDTSRKDNQNLHVRYESRMYLMSDYTEELALAHGSQNWGAFSFNTLKKFITDNVSEEFLPEYLK